MINAYTGLLTSICFCILQTYLASSGLIAFFRADGCNSDGGFLTMLYSSSSFLISIHAMTTYFEILIRRSTSDWFGKISFIIFIIQAIFIMIFGSFIKTNLTMIHTGCLSTYWTVSLFLSTASIWISLIWIAIARIYPIFQASYKLAQDKIKLRIANKFYSELEDMYGSIYNVQKHSILTQFLRTHEKDLERYPLSEMEIARLKDMFKVKEIDEHLNRKCSECHKILTQDQKVFGHPGCGHNFHMDCLNFNYLTKCPTCNSATRYNMLMDLRKELYPSM